MTTFLFQETTQLDPVLTGRDSEIALVGERLDLGCHGSGSVVTVAGAAGVGKSRLLDEIEIAAVTRGMLVLRGAAEAVRSNVAYGLFVGVFKGCLPHLSLDDQAELQRSLRESAPHLIDELFSDAGKSSVSPDIDSELRQTLFLASTARLLLSLAERTPLVVCLDDLHSADSASLHLLRYLATRCSNSPLSIITTYRPEQSEGEVAEALSELEGHAHCHALELTGLTPDQTRSFVSACFPLSGFSDELLDSVYEKTQGLPLFLVQLLELMREEDVIFKRRGVWMDRSIREPEGPGSIQDALRERFRGLSEPESQFMTYAALQGETFDRELVAEALGWSDTEVQQILARLQLVRHLIKLHRGVYSFENILIANAFLAQLSQEKRQAAHLRLAECLERLRPDLVELQAHNFYQAGAGKRALPYLEKAGQRYFDAQAFWEARRTWDQALSVIDQEDGPNYAERRLDLMLSLAETDELLGELTSSEALCREVLDRTSNGGDRGARALMMLGWLQYRAGA